MRIGEALQALRTHLGISTQTDLAERLQACGMTTVKQPHISRWERGNARLTLEQMNQIEECLGRPRGWILTKAGYIDVAGLLTDVSLLDNGADVQAALEANLHRIDETLVREFGARPASEPDPPAAPTARARKRAPRA